jgi:hypothetical protein
MILARVDSPVEDVYHQAPCRLLESYCIIESKHDKIHYNYLYWFFVIL